jgi:SAM-dependent methyltransferase
MTPREQLHRLYRHHHGWLVEPAAEKAIVRAKSSSTYGELWPSALERLVEKLELGKNDVVLDLGSGIGKVVMQLAMMLPLRRVAGYELVASRHVIASGVLARARARRLVRARRVDLVCGDLMRADLADATVVYTCSTAFPDAFMRRLARKLHGLHPGARLVTLQELDVLGRFRLEETIALDTTWRRAVPVHVYRLAAPR